MNLRCTSLWCGRKPESSEKTHADPGELQTPHRQCRTPSIRFFLVNDTAKQRYSTTTYVALCASIKKKRNPGGIENNLLCCIACLHLKKNKTNQGV